MLTKATAHVGSDVIEMKSANPKPGGLRHIKLDRESLPSHTNFSGPSFHFLYPRTLYIFTINIVDDIDTSYRRHGPYSQVVCLSMPSLLLLRRVKKQSSTVGSRQRNAHNILPVSILRGVSNGPPEYGSDSCTKASESGQVFLALQGLVA